MAGVDLSRYRFDYDLTFCCLLMNADGTLYHVYGGRDATDAQSHLSMVSLTSALRRTLDEHRAYRAKPMPPKLAKRRVIEDAPAFQRRKKQECVHCHTIHDVAYEEAVESGRWVRDDIWIYPDPVEIGIRVDRDDQTRITHVEAASAADRAGLEPGDRLVSIAGRPVGTFGDIQSALHGAERGKVELEISWSRGGDRLLPPETHAAGLRLAAGWKEATPEVFAWRPSKWPLSPKPGFGGRPIDADEKDRLGIPTDTFAFRVGYVVTWGPNKHTGHNARKAGIRKNDIVYDICGKQDFRSMEHFHAWFRLTRRIGETCKLKRVRGGKHETLRLEVIE